MQIKLVLDVSPDDADDEHSTGVTPEAFDRLSQALLEAGFEIVIGPDAVRE